MALASARPPVVMPRRAEGGHLPPRLTAFRFDLLGRRLSDSGEVINEALIGHLDSAAVTGYIKYDGYGTVKAGGSLDLEDIGQEIDWLNTRIRPVALLQAPAGSPTVQVPLGVYLPSAPVERWTATGRRWTVEMMDKLTILDQDIHVDEDGSPTSFALDEGANVVAAVKALIESTGESSGAIEPGDRVLSSPLVWATGASKLRIITDLLQAADYFSLDTDGAGNYRTSPYIPPQERPPVYAAEGPFGSPSLLHPEWTLDHDIFVVPNRFVAIGQGDGEQEALVATIVNDDPDSPFSYQARGRWITVVDEGVEAVDIDALLSYAQRRMALLSTTAMDFSVRHLYLPDLRVGSVVRFEGGGLDLLAVVRTTQVPFDPLGLVSTSLRAVG